MVLNDEEMNMINRLRHGKYPHKNFDPYAYYGTDFTAEKRIEILGNAQRPKANFVPSKWEAKQVIRLVHAIRNGWIKVDEEEKPKEEVSLSPG